MKDQIHKYTKDGRKVVVIGKLNAAEYIVQEIFCTGDGAEIPSGEQFVEKTLMDAPAVSWKEKNLAKAEALYDKEKARTDRELKALREKYEKSRDHLKAVINAAGYHRIAFEEQTFGTFLDFIAGRISHVVVSDWGKVEIMTLEDALALNDRWDHDGFRLLSLYGKGVKDFEWRINKYSDGSGSGGQTVLPAKSFDHAREIVAEVITEKLAADNPRFCESWIQTREELNLAVPTDEQIKAFRLSCLKNVNKRTADLAKQHQESVDKGKELERLANGEPE